MPKQTSSKRTYQDLTGPFLQRTRFVRTDYGSTVKVAGEGCRKKFIFVQHLYSQFSERGQHRHPWLHLSIVQRGHYERSLGKRVSHYRSGGMAFLTTDESHTDSYAPGTKCLHLVIPSDFETQLTRDLVGRGGSN